jgi:hypothetical protein
LLVLSEDSAFSKIAPPSIDPSTSIFGRQDSPQGRLGLLILANSQVAVRKLIKDRRTILHRRTDQFKLHNRLSEPSDSKVRAPKQMMSYEIVRVHPKNLVRMEHRTLRIVPEQRLACFN